MRVLVHLNLDYNCIDYNPFLSINDVVEVSSSQKGAIYQNLHI